MSGPDIPPNSPLGAMGPVTHYEGFADLKGPKDKDYEKMWLMLIDKSLHAYIQKFTKREASTAKPVESLLIDKNWEIKPDMKEKTKLSIKCKAGSFKFRMSTQDDRDNWWIRFHAISKRTLPNVNLLPGQTIAVKEIIDSLGTIPDSPASAPAVKTHKTFVKQKSGDKPKEEEPLNKKYHFYAEELVNNFRDDFPIPPTWFLSTTRLQAEEILLNNPEHGAILIRESESHPGDFSLSMRQDPPLNNLQAQPIVKHFRFSWLKSTHTFRMEIEEQQPQLKTMYDLLAFFIEKHGGNIRPLQTRDFSVLKIHQHPYESGLRLSQKDPENGEAHRQSQDTYLEPQRAPPAPPSKPRPERQSLPASFNMPLDHVLGTETAGASNAFHLPSSDMSNSQYVLPGGAMPAYLNSRRDKLPIVAEDSEQHMSRRQQRFSTVEMPSFMSMQASDDSNAPVLPPPRQRAVSSSDASALDAYSTPSGQMFLLLSPKIEKPSLEVKLAAARVRSQTTPALSEDSPRYLTPINRKPCPSQAAGNPSLPSAIKPTVSPKPSIFKPPSKSLLGFQQPMAPSTSYIHPDVKLRGNSDPSSPEGTPTALAEGELNKIFKKFGLNSST